DPTQPGGKVLVIVCGEEFAAKCPINAPAPAPARGAKIAEARPMLPGFFNAYPASLCKVSGPEIGDEYPSGKISVIDCNCISPREPLRPNLSSLPCTNVPAGITTSLPTVIGAVV